MRRLLLFLLFALPAWGQSTGLPNDIPPLPSNLYTVPSFIGVTSGGVVAGSFGASPSVGYTITNTAMSSPWSGKLIVGDINTVNGSNSAFTAGTGFTIAATSGITGTVTNVMSLEYLTGASATSYSSALTVPASVGPWSAGIAAFSATSPALVQAAASTTSGPTTLAFSSNNAAGNCLIAAFRYTNAAFTPITSVTDTRGNTWLRAGIPSPSPSPVNYVEVWYAQNSIAGANTLTVTYGAGSSAGEIVIAEFSGVATSNALLDYAIASGAQVTSIPGATTDPQNTYSAVNNANGNIDFTGTDAAVVVNSALGNLIGTGGQLYFKNGFYNIRSMTQDSVFNTNFWGIGIPASPTIVTGVQFILSGETKTNWTGELAEQGAAANNTAVNGTIFNVTAQAMANVGTNTAIGIWQRPSNNASYRAINEDFLQNLAVRFPTNQTPNQIGIGLYYGHSTNQYNVLADYNLPYGTIATNPLSAAGNIGITDSLSGFSNVQHIVDSYAVGSQFGFDVGEHTVASGLTSIYCTNAGRARTNNHDITLIKINDQENQNGWVLDAAASIPAEINIFGYDIEIDNTNAAFARVKDLSESTPGTWRGQITFSRINQTGTQHQSGSPNIFGAANVNGGDGFVVTYGGGIRGTGFVQSLAQTASITATNLLPHPFAGAVYEVDFYLVTTTAGTGGTVSFTLTWNDGTAQTFTSSNLNLNAQGSLSGRVLIKVASGAIQYSTTVTAPTGSPQYSLDVREIPRS